MQYHARVHSILDMTLLSSAKQTIDLVYSLEHRNSNRMMDLGREGFNFECWSTSLTNLFNTRPHFYAFSHVFLVIGPDLHLWLLGFTYARSPYSI